MKILSNISVLAALLLGIAAMQANSSAAPIMPAFEKDNRILFQGDSITDGNRGRSADPNHILGHGYAFIIAAKYGAELAERNLTFINRGVSGNKVSDLANRWQNDTLNLKPDILSVLIGVNDASANVSVEQYEAALDKLLHDTVTALPNVRLVLCFPFTLPGKNHKADWDTWRANIGHKQDAVARLATKYGAALVDFQKAFDDAAKRAPAEYWIWDTIHPTYSGHQIMADEWIRAVSAFKFAPRASVPPLMSTPLASTQYEGIKESLTWR
jgi:lysophospholipase L1-like esterase